MALAPLLLAATLFAAPGLTADAGASGTGQGYLLVGSDGGAFNYGNIGYYGSEAGLGKTISAASVTNSGAGYIEIGTDGAVYSFGNAPNYGSVYSLGHGSFQSWQNGTILGGVLTSDNGGYWLVSNNGWVCGFGDAGVYSSQNTLLGTNNCWFVAFTTIVGVAADPANGGYWFVTYKGEVYALHGAPYEGGAPGITNAVGMSPTIDGNGYRIAGSDGGVFAYGDAGFYGSLGGSSIANVSGILSTVPNASGGGYILVRSNGAVFFFGDAAYLGSREDQPLNGPTVGIA
jgi:hypothetical protein